MKKLLKSFFCNHKYNFHRIIFGDQINYSLPDRKVERCFNCGKFKYSEMTDKDWIEYYSNTISKEITDVLNSFTK